MFCFSQTENLEEKKPQTSSKNQLSKYFKKKVPKKLLKNIRYGRNLNSITLSFYINSENKPYRISFNTFGNSKLNEAVKKAFGKYPLKKLELDTLSKKKKYSFQIISKKGKRNIFKTSNKISSSSLPILNSCEDLEYYEDIEQCLQTEIKKHYFNNIDFSIADALDDDLIKLNLSIIINKENTLILEKVKAPSPFLKNIKIVTNSFTKFKSLAITEGQKTEFKYKFSIDFKKGDRPTYLEKDINFDTVFEPNSTNDFAKYILENLKEADRNKANLNRVNSRLILYFELDKTNTPFKISTNSRSQYLEKKIISLFKKYSLKKLNFINKSAFNSYYTPILIFKDNKTIVSTGRIIGYSKVPVFPGCKKAESVSEAKACFSKGVQMHFTKNFNSNLPNQLGLSKGRKRVFIGFTIDKNGIIKRIQVKAPHPAIKNEVTRVMLSFPKVIPGLRGNKPVNIKYSIPFTLIVD
jgi:hypothetical protein